MFVTYEWGEIQPILYLPVRTNNTYSKGSSQTETLLSFKYKMRALAVILATIAGEWLYSFISHK